MLHEFKGKKLTYARNRVGMSMQDIADLISVKRQYVHKIETGKESKSFSGDQLLLIANHLGVDVEYFFKENEISISNDRLHFRSVSIPNYIRDRAKIYAEDFIAVCLYIRNYIEPLGLELPHFDLDEQCGTENITSNAHHKLEIEAIANEVRVILGLGFGPISNMVRVLETSGVIICTAPEISQKVDAFCNDDIFPVVVRNDYKSPVRCRFDLAHELGHLILHKGMNNDVVENPMIEKQANHFASCLLLPKTTFMTEFPQFHSKRIPWDSLLEMKLRWKVSIAALIMRAHELGLITDAARQKAFIHISHKGWRTCEPGDKPEHQKYIELEQPELIKNAVQLIMNTHKNFLPEMKAHLNFSNSLIRETIGMPNIPDVEFNENASKLSVVVNR
ncbi:XRE family transcriptional regulator [Kiloniella sp. EL199]|uniref:helix-turn-helix domain-containing protein n=1 Tax=Kiloniella sp. EL199 TaxID=2107581 RepID=UPI000EA1A1BE|nr:XRE family transcriptional regulator [Kiloniella sp. EL199]